MSQVQAERGAAANPAYPVDEGPAISKRWIGGNRIVLLEGGEQYYPRVFDAIDRARHEVLIETFILFEDKVGIALHEVLVRAAQRGVQIDLTIDGYGSPDLSPQFITTLTAAGVRVHVFDPRPKLWGYRTNLFRRMHRKIVVADGQIAFVGGLNFSADHLADFGPQAKLDHAIEIEGPLVPEIRGFVRSQLATAARHYWHRFRRRPALPPTPAPPAAGHADALFVIRDNGEHTSNIERHYRIAIRAARKRVWIAMAYFFPGYRLLHELRKAARRGVDVRLILQGEPDMPSAKFWASMLYHHLLRAGVHIHEYHEKPLHSKVALADDEWATVGSSNLDPLSLSLNLEANVMIRDRDFNRGLSERLQQLMAESCNEVRADQLTEPRLWLLVRSFFVFHVMRHYPAWAGWLPAHVPRLAPARSKLPERVEAALEAGTDVPGDADAPRSVERRTEQSTT
jgi:cardiolipin synthase A/B